MELSPGIDQLSGGGNMQRRTSLSLDSPRVGGPQQTGCLSDGNLWNRYVYDAQTIAQYYSSHESLNCLVLQFTRSKGLLIFIAAGNPVSSETVERMPPLDTNLWCASLVFRITFRVFSVCWTETFVLLSQVLSRTLTLIPAKESQHLFLLQTLKGAPSTMS